MMAYGQEMADDGGPNPRDDIVSRIVNAEVDGERLTDDEFQMFWLAARRRRQRDHPQRGVRARCVALARARPVVLARRAPRASRTAVEELLRYVSPVHPVPPHRHAGHRCSATSTSRAGDKVVIWFGAANRDPDVFADPHRLDLRRDPNPHVAFGIGPHFCLGATWPGWRPEMLRSCCAHAPDLTVGGPARVRVQLHQRHRARAPVRVARSVVVVSRSTTVDAPLAEHHAPDDLHVRAPVLFGRRAVARLDEVEQPLLRAHARAGARRAIRRASSVAAHCGHRAGDDLVEHLGDDGQRLVPGERDQPFVERGVRDAEALRVLDARPPPRG